MILEENGRLFSLILRLSNIEALGIQSGLNQLFISKITLIHWHAHMASLTFKLRRDNYDYNSDSFVSILSEGTERAYWCCPVRTLSWGCRSPSLLPLGSPRSPEDSSCPREWCRWSSQHTLEMSACRRSVAPHYSLPCEGRNTAALFLQLCRVTHVPLVLPWLCVFVIKSESKWNEIHFRGQFRGVVSNLRPRSPA